MTLTAVVRDKQDKEVLTITRDSYASKKAFKNELHQNGYTVIGRIYAEGDENTRLGKLYWCNGVR